MTIEELTPDEDLIPAEKFCASHHIEASFIRVLHESGLITVKDLQGSVFLQAAELPELEKFVRWHYELSINPEGIEVIDRLLRQIDELREENRSLLNKLRRYESGEPHAFREADL